MNFSEVLSDATQAINLILLASLPPVFAAIGVGIIISLIQALTQVQEQTLSFGFKLVAVILTLMVIMETLGQQFISFTSYVFDKAAMWQF